MFPFKQIKSSLSHQHLPQTIPPIYPNLISSQSQLQIRRERINAVPQYDIQPKSTENLADLREIYNYQSSNGTPLSFNANPNYKYKIKKTTRPISGAGNKTFEGPPSQRNQVEDFRPEQRGCSREKLEDYSRITSKMLNNFSFQASEQYQTVKTEYTPEKIYTLAKNRQQNVKQWTPAYRIQNKPQNVQAQAAYKTNPRINFIHHNSSQHPNQSQQIMGVNQQYLVQNKKNQQETIENYQKQILHLNAEVRQLKNSNQHLLRQYDQIAKQLRNRDEKKLDDNIVEWQREQHNKFLAEIEKMQKQLKGKNSLNLYLQQQCNFYTENYEKQVVESRRQKQQHEKQKQKLNQIIFQVKKQLDQKQKIKTDQNIVKELETRLSSREQEIENLKKITDLQLAKIEKQQHDIQIDRSEINMLFMKMESLQSKTQQLTIELQQNAKKYQEDLFKEKQSKIQQLMMYNQKLSEKSVQLLIIEQKWRRTQEQCKKIEIEYKQVDLYCKQIEKEKIALNSQIKNLNQQFENRLNLQEKEYKISEQTCKVKEQLIAQYRSKLDSFNQRQKQKDGELQQMKSKYQNACQLLDKAQEEKSQLTIKLRQVIQHLNREEHISCRMSIQKLKDQLNSIIAEKQQIIMQRQNQQYQRTSIKLILQGKNKICQELQAKTKDLTQQNIKLQNSLQNYLQTQVQNSKLAENMIRMRLLEEENKRLTDTSERYQVVVLQNCLMSQKIQSYKNLEQQNIKVSQKLQKVKELQILNSELRNQIKKLQAKYQDQNIDFSLTKNQLSIQRSKNQKNSCTIEQFEKTNQKISQLIAQIEQYKHHNLRLVKEKQDLLLTLKSFQVFKEQTVQDIHIKEQKYQSQIEKYIKLIEQNQIIYETQVQKQRRCTQSLEKELLTINTKLLQLEKNQLENEIERLSSKGSIRSLKNLQLSPRKMNNQNDTSFVDYMEVDREGLLFICELLKIDYVEGGIINKIIQQLENELKIWQLSKKYAHFYSQLLELFGIQQKQENNELLLSQIKGIKNNLSFLIQKISQEQIRANQSNKNVQFLSKEVLKNKLKVGSLKKNNQQLIVLNNDLNEQIVTAYAKLCNQRQQTKMVLNIIEDDSSYNQNRISIVTSQPFFSAKSFRATEEGINN